VALAFSPCSEQLLVVTGDNRHTLHLVHWRSKRQLLGSSCHNGQPPQVYGALWNPFLLAPGPAAAGANLRSSSSAPGQSSGAAAGSSSQQLMQGRMFVTYGVKHLKIWVRGTGSSGKEAWQATSGRFGATAPLADVLSCCFLPREWLVTGAPTGELLLWDVEGGRGGFGSCIRVRSRRPAEVPAALALWPRLHAAKLLLTQLKPVSLHACCPLQAIQAHGPGLKAPSIHDGKPSLQGVRALALRSNGMELISSGADGQLLVWGVDAAGSGLGLTGLVERIEVGTQCLPQPILAEWAAGCSHTHPLCRPSEFVRSTGQPPHPPARPPAPQFQDPAERHPASVRALDVQPGGGCLVLGTSRCDLWELQRSGPPQPLVQGHSGDVCGAAFHPTKPYRPVHSPRLPSAPAAPCPGRLGAAAAPCA
jgi:hypothetical protein